MRCKNKKFGKSGFFFIVLIFSAAINLFSQDYEIDYCGIFSDDLDLNMAKLTSDLYYTQLSEFQNFSVTDRRPEFDTKDINSVDTNLFTPSKKTFFVEINKIEKSDKWEAVFHIYYQNTKAETIKNYDSYYKILMEPKDNLQKTLSALITQGGTQTAKTDVKDSATAAGSDEDFAEKTAAVSTEFLSGTWKGENGLNKIVIMKGGRGFVIFSNGASMNISIKMNDNSGSKKITVKQNQKSNASYFPELSREAALKHAVDAEPIEWVFQAQSSDTLTGEKRTLIDAGGQISYANIPVTWTRIN